MATEGRWDDFTPEQVDSFLRGRSEGRDHPSRVKVVDLLDGLGSLLDVGCGTGVMFEVMRDCRPDVDYMGVDVTEKFIAAARARFPSDATRFLRCSIDDLPSLARSFDAVLGRHVLEHLSDYVPAIQQMYACARRKLILIFYLPPRPLGGRKHDERLQPGFYTHTYDLGRLVDHLLNDLSPAPKQLRIHPRQGRSDPATTWADRENIIYELIRADDDQSQPNSSAATPAVHPAESPLRVPPRVPR
jgi:SAM-dependent methyltransferase